MKGKKAKALLAMLLAVQMAASGATVAFAQGATLDVARSPAKCWWKSRRASSTSATCNGRT